MKRNIIWLHTENITNLFRIETHRDFDTVPGERRIMPTPFPASPRRTHPGKINGRMNRLLIFTTLKRNKKKKGDSTYCFLTRNHSDTWRKYKKFLKFDWKQYTIEVRMLNPPAACSVMVVAGTSARWGISPKKLNKNKKPKHISKISTHVNSVQGSLKDEEKVNWCRHAQYQKVESGSVCSKI